MHDIFLNSGFENFCSLFMFILNFKWQCTTICIFTGLDPHSTKKTIVNQCKTQPGTTRIVCTGVGEKVKGQSFDIDLKP